jgi:3-dehydroquinate synthase
MTGAMSKYQLSIFLYGPSGSGKSTVGRILANKLNLPFVDLDDEIESTSGMDIPSIFVREGEAGFRGREADALREIADELPQIIALGGGALTNPVNLDLVQENGEVLVLGAPLDTLLQRLKNDTVIRPLLNGDARGRLAELIDRRKDHYQSFPNQVDTTDKEPGEVAWEIQVQLGRFHLRGMASSKHPAYDVWVQAGGLDYLGGHFLSRDLRGPIALVSDENVGSLYMTRVEGALRKAGYTTASKLIPVGEAHKNLETVQQLWDFYLSARIERGSTIVALGGGVVGDLVGFSAATFLRGISWVVVPTSLLAMVDSSCGGKTGADLPQGKNLVGAFYPPAFVLADPEVLRTLPDPEFKNGMAEVIKHGVIADPFLFSSCSHVNHRAPTSTLSSLVSRGMAVKIKIIEEDPFEKGFRAALNLGHTVGHGVELTSGFNIRHGEAVSIGMVVEVGFAEKIGLALPGLRNEITSMLKTQGLPVNLPPGMEAEKIAASMKHDKKVSEGVIKFALPVGIGEVRVGVEVADWEMLLEDEIRR